MSRKTLRRLFTPLVLGVLALLAHVSSAGAQPGTGLATISTVPPCTDGAAGIGVAFDGTNILFTCALEAKVHLTDLTGANLGSVDTKDSGGSPVAVDAIAWDSNENKLWGGNLDGAGNCRIWSIDMGTGIATPRFSFSDTNCGFTFFDGITVDTNTNTLYLSPDVNQTIHHFDKSGVPVSPDIPFTTLTAGQCPGSQFGNPNCLNSGLTIGLDGVLFAGTNGAGRIFELDPTVPSVLGQFASVSGRDEDLECGPLFTKQDGSVVETILSREFFSGRIDVLEAPHQTCVIFKITLTPASATNPIRSTHTVTANVTINGKADAGQIVLFSVSGVNPTSGSGTTDASGNASFSYVGPNAGNDAITACADINKNGVCDPDEPTATATKQWVHVFQLTLVPSTDTNTVLTTHTVTANLTDVGLPVPGAAILFSVSGVTSPAPSGSGTTDALGNASFSYVGNNLGLDVISACADVVVVNGTCDKGEPTASAQKKWIDDVPPVASCVESVNPAGKNIPPAGTTLPGTKGGQNPDGFYRLGAKDNFDPNPKIFVQGTSGNPSPPFGPFTNGIVVKITEAPGATPSIQPMGGPSSAVAWHITLDSDAVVIAVDSSGNVGTATCLVPPPPK